MAIGAATTWQSMPTGSATNGGGFNVANTNFATDLAATTATGVPVVTSASYNFVSGDVGAYVFIKSGTNWIPGWYQIASVASNAATLTATVGSANLYGGATVLNTATGCATTASPTTGTWGVDYSQQAAAQVAVANAVTAGTTTITSATASFGKNHIGNLIYVTGGTGAVAAAWYEVVSVTNVTTIVVDRSTGLTTGTGATLNLGGAVNGFTTLASCMVTANLAFVQAGSGYTSTATATFAQVTSPSRISTFARLVGFTTYRGDGGMATLTLSTNTGLTGLLFSSGAWRIENLTINCASLGTSTGISVSFQAEIFNCKVQNFTLLGITTTSSGNNINFCEITGGTSAATEAVLLSSSLANVLINSWIHDNACPGVNSSTGGLVLDNLITNNTGASSDGVIYSGINSTVRSNVIYGNGRHGINWSSGGNASVMIRNNILSQNSGYGISYSAGAGTGANAYYDGNAYYSNTSGNRQNLDDVGTTTALNGVAPYINTKDITLTADPFMAKASNDFRLNTTAGGGAACRGFGVPTTWPGNSLTVAAPDMGAAQHADPSGGGANLSRVFSGF